MEREAKPDAKPTTRCFQDVVLEKNTDSWRDRVSNDITLKRTDEKLILWKSLARRKCKLLGNLIKNNKA